MSQLSIENVINISVSEPQTGIGAYNTSNLALFSSEAYESSFGNDGYKIYLDPTEVAEDFGSDSKTYAQALAVFSQQPNILANGGYLVIFAMITEVVNFALSGLPASGSFTITFPQGTTAAIDWDATAEEIQDIVRAIEGLEQAVVTGKPLDEAFSIALKGVYGSQALPSIGGVGLETSAPVSITITPSEHTDGETIAEAITRTIGTVQYFGIMGSDIYSQSDMLAAAAVVQAVNKIAFFVQSDAGAIDEGGELDLLRTGGFSKSRGLYYGVSASNSDPLVYQAAYAGRALSTVFNGSNTTQTMHLKDLNGVQPDSTVDQTALNKAKLAGADVYISIQGISKLFTSGANGFFDDVYNLGWFVGDLQIATFNVLAQTSTKIAQTENGVNSLKSAARQVCEQAKTNQFVAPGRWTNPTTFGNQQDLFNNVQERGYYIYSQPVSQQSSAARQARQAPVIQLAIKYAGAIHSASIIVNINQ